MSKLAELLACPRCDKNPLESTDSGYRCSGCKVTFPSFAGMPWMFAEPRAAMEDWRGRWHFALRGIERNRHQIDRALESTELLQSTRKRLETTRVALQAHMRDLRALLAPLDIDRNTAEYATYLALRTRLPSDQGLLTYYNNVHRDWAWGEQENRESLDVLLEAKGDHPARRILVLGAGSGRLAYDLHQHTAADSTAALDFNPFLSILGKRITAGDSIELYEFPIAPKDAEHTAVLRSLGAPQPARPGLEFIVADAHRPPFRRHQFDVVVTPWLIDIVPEQFDSFALRINSLLADHGLWLNFGSLSFREGPATSRYNLEECVEVVGASGFDIARLGTKAIPYMCSPASRHGRREEVVYWSAIRERAVKRVPRYEALPDWLVRGNAPIPLSEAIRTQAMTTRIHAFIMSLIDGKRTLKDMAGIVVEQRLMTAAEAEPAIRGFLIKMLDEARRMGG